MSEIVPERANAGMSRMTEFETLMQLSGWTVADAAENLGYSEGHIYRWKRGEETPRDAVLKLMRMQVEAKRAPDSGASFSFIDLFAGIGGLRKAMASAGGTCVFTSEWDKFAQQTYHANFADNRPIGGDIRDVALDDIPEHNVLVAGFPCQPFSIAGVSKKNALGRKHGFACDAQGTLFFRLAGTSSLKQARTPAPGSTTMTLTSRTPAALSWSLTSMKMVGTTSSGPTVTATGCIGTNNFHPSRMVRRTGDST